MFDALQILFIGVVILLLFYFGCIATAVLTLFFIELWTCSRNIFNCIVLSNRKDSKDSNDSDEEIIKTSAIIIIKNPDGHLQLGKINI